MVLCAVLVNFRKVQSIQGTTDIPFNYLGYSPAVCLNDDGYIILVWATTHRKLKNITTNIPNPECPSISYMATEGFYKKWWQWPPPYDCNLSRWYENLEEHETNLVPYNYYRTGVLEKTWHQGQAPHQEQVKYTHKRNVHPQPELEQESTAIVQPQEEPQRPELEQECATIVQLQEGEWENQIMLQQSYVCILASTCMCIKWSIRDKLQKLCGHKLIDNLVLPWWSTTCVVHLQPQ